MTIPVVDFSKLNGEERAETLAQIDTCCKDWGFFQVVNHGIPVEVLERVKKVTTQCYMQERIEAFYKQSKAVEMLNSLKLMEEKISTDTADNDDDLMINQEKQKLLQGVDWEDVFLLLDGNEWPTQTPGFKETMTEYRAEVKKLAEKVMEAMDDNLGLPIGYIKRAFNSNGSTSDIHSDKSSGAAFFGTKVSHYPACPEPEKVMGLRAHTDAGGVILLYQDEEVKGLQILKDDTWINVQPLPNAIIVNTGDQIEVLSNGRYKSVWHRVLAQPDGTRRSIASFYNPCLKATIAPAPMLLHEVEMELKEELKADDDDHKFVQPSGNVCVCSAEVSSKGTKVRSCQGHVTALLVVLYVYTTTPRYKVQTVLPNGLQQRRVILVS